MMLMEGQLSHIGFDARCRLLFALFAADDDVGCEDIDQKKRPRKKIMRGGGGIRRGIKIVGWRES